MKFTMIRPCTGERTIKISVSYRIIEKDYQELKIFIEGKILQKYLKRKNNCLSRMPLKEPITEPTYHRYRGSTYVKKCRSAPTLFTPNYKLIQHIQQNDDQTLLWFSLIFLLSYVFYVIVPFLPPLPLYHNHLTTTHIS